MDNVKSKILLLRLKKFAAECKYVISICLMCMYGGCLALALPLTYVGISSAHKYFKGQFINPEWATFVCTLIVIGLILFFSLFSERIFQWFNDFGDKQKVKAVEYKNEIIFLKIKPPPFECLKQKTYPNKSDDSNVSEPPLKVNPPITYTKDLGEEMSKKLQAFIEDVKAGRHIWNKGSLQTASSNRNSTSRKTSSSTKEIVEDETDSKSPIRKTTVPPVVIENLDELFISNDSPIIKRTNAVMKISPKQHIANLESNQNLGSLGEKFIMFYEELSLVDKGMNLLAGQVIHVSINDDSLGYDIISFDEEGNEKYIEVKTTTKGYNTDFFFTDREMQNITLLRNYFIYRVFNFNFETNSGDIYIVNCSNDFNTYFTFKPTIYKITPKRK